MKSNIEKFLEIFNIEFNEVFCIDTGNMSCKFYITKDDKEGFIMYGADSKTPLDDTATGLWLIQLLKNHSYITKSSEEKDDINQELFENKELFEKETGLDLLYAFTGFKKCYYILSLQSFESIKKLVNKFNEKYNLDAIVVDDAVRGKLLYL